MLKSPNATPLYLNNNFLGEPQIWIWEPDNLRLLNGITGSSTDISFGSPGKMEGRPLVLPRGVNGNLSLAFFTDSSIRVASWDGSRWNIIISTARVPDMSAIMELNESVSFDSLGRPHIIYVSYAIEGYGCGGVVEKDKGILHHAFWNGKEWVIQNVNE